MMTSRLWRVLSIAGISAVTYGSAAPTADTSAPHIIIVHGELLPQRVVLSDWNENLLLMASVDAMTQADTTVVQQRPYVHLAMFWGPQWAHYPRTPEALTELRVEQSTQHGRFYPAQQNLGALVLIGATVGREYATLGPIREEGMAVLERHKVPVRVD